MKRSGGIAFALWGVVGVLLALAFVSLPSIGLLVLAAGLMAALVAAWLLGWTAACAGIVAGVGALLLLVGGLDLDGRPCPSSGAMTLSPGQGSASCAGSPPAPWLTAGAVLVLVGAAGYRYARARRSPTG